MTLNLTPAIIGSSGGGDETPVLPRTRWIIQRDDDDEKCPYS